MFIERLLARLLQREISARPCIVLTGARQTGKTTLLKHLLPGHRYVSLDLPSLAERAERNPDEFLREHEPPLIIDEVQYAPALFRHLKHAIDGARAVNGRFVLTGSQKFVLMREVADSLAGRASILELEGLSLHEIAAVLPNYRPEDIILRGTLPELYEKPELDGSLFHQSYITSYLERDVQALSKVSSLRDFERFLRACALRSGQLLNKAELARDVGISPSTANEWISILAASNQIVLLEPWFANRTKSLVKSPKLYMIDIGLMTTLLDIRSRDDLLRSPLLGSIWETYVYAELRRAQLNTAGFSKLFFYRDQSREVDFVIDRGGTLSLYDAKWSELPEKRDGAHLDSVRSALGAERVIRTAIIGRPESSYSLENSIGVVTVRDAVHEVYAR